MNMKQGKKLGFILINVNQMFRSISTFTTCQHPDGGFGAGTGFLAHLATSYATILSLAIVGSRDAFELIDRKSL